MRHPARAVRLALLAVAFVASWTAAQAQDARDAVVRITSHGGSGTVVMTEQGRTLVLSAAHVFQGREKVAIAIDAPWQKGPQDGDRKAAMRLVAVGDPAADDLALLEIADGPWPAVCPVAPAGHKPSRNLWSCGYDEMKWPMVRERATLTGQDALHWYTRESPWHGRSGGGLIDLDQGVLIGVVQAYQTAGPGGPRIRGVYGSHQAVLTFLAGVQGGQQLAPQGGPADRMRILQLEGVGGSGAYDPDLRPTPRTAPRQQPQAAPAPAPNWRPYPSPYQPYTPPPEYRPAPQFYAPPGGCPGGQCPNCPR